MFSDSEQNRLDDQLTFHSFEHFPQRPKSHSTLTRRTLSAETRPDLMSDKVDDVEKVDKHISRKYDIQQKLGKGAYAVVFKAIDKKTKDVVAIKKIFDAFQNQTDAQRTFREIAYLLMLQGVQCFNSSADAASSKAVAASGGIAHPNIIKLRNFHKAENDKDVYLVFDFMETDLHAVVRANILEPVHKQFIVYQSLKALKYCHTAGLLHRDLKPSNLLLNEDCVLKVADFGLARALHEIEGMAEPAGTLTDYVATRWYRAPEILLGSTSYTRAVDVWALGCIIAEMFIGKPLLAGSSTINQIERIVEVTGVPDAPTIEALRSKYAATMLREPVNLIDKYPPATAGYRLGMLREKMKGAPEEAIQMVCAMLEVDPSKRMDVHGALAHAWMKPFRKEDEDKQDVCEPLKACIDDDTKLSVNDYRDELYKGLKLLAKGDKTETSSNKFFKMFPSRSAR